MNETPNLLSTLKIGKIPLKYNNTTKMATNGINHVSVTASKGITQVKQALTSAGHVINVEPAVIIRE